MERLVPESDRQSSGGWRLTLVRLWCVLGLICAWFVLTEGTRELHFRAAVFTLAGFYGIWQVVAWIFRPALPPQDKSE